MTLLLRVGGVVLLVGAVGLGAGFAWARTTASARLERTWQTHRVDFPVPFPLTAQEVDALKAERLARTDEAQGNAPAELDLKAVATERALARARHLLESRYACLECHGKDLGGGIMMDAAPVGRFVGPNLTSGKGGVVSQYTVVDWDRMVRHGVKPNGQGSVMPSLDFLEMSDQELSDIIAYIRAAPPVDKEQPPSTLGPIGYVLMAKGDMLVSAERSQPDKAHPVAPPDPGETVAFGKHLLQTCTGCHGSSLAGGPIAGGDPSWPPAAPLTPQGLAGWTLADFQKAMRSGVSKDGRMVQEPMKGVVNATKAFTDQELAALWAALQAPPAQ